MLTKSLLNVSFLLPHAITNLGARIAFYGELHAGHRPQPDKLSNARRRNADGDAPTKNAGAQAGKCYVAHPTPQPFISIRARLINFRGAGRCNRSTVRHCTVTAGTESQREAPAALSDNHRRTARIHHRPERRYKCRGISPLLTHDRWQSAVILWFLESTHQCP